MKRFRRTLRTILSLFVILALIGTSSIFAVSENEDVLRFSALRDHTEEYENLLQKKNKSSEYNSDDTLDITINRTLNRIDALLVHEGNKLSGIFTGNLRSVSLDSIEGFVGVYEGCIAWGDTQPTALLNVVYTPDEMFVILTMYVDGLEYAPKTLFFGELTDNLKKISTAHAKSQLEETSKQELRNNMRLEGIKSLDFTVYPQNENYITAGSFVVGKLWSFHPNVIVNGVTSLVSMKTTTTTYGPENYISSTLGYSNCVLAVADKIEMTMESTASDLYLSLNNSYYPLSQTNTVTVPVPVYLGQYVGVSVINISLTLSKLVAASSKTISNCTNNNKVTWTYTHNYSGWNRSLTNESSSGNTGIGGQATYWLAGNLSSTQTRTMKYTGNLRFMYYLEYGFDELVEMSFLSNTTTMYSSYTAYPQQ